MKNERREGERKEEGRREKERNISGTKSVPAVCGHHVMLDRRFFSTETRMTSVQIKRQSFPCTQ
jgi:hypothetical protein